MSAITPQKPLHVFVACVPPTATHSAHQQVMKRADGSHFVMSRPTGPAGQAKKFLALKFRPHHPFRPFEGPLGVAIRIAFPWRKGETKTRMAAGNQPCGVRPDVDNLLKGLLDTLTAERFWHDDGQIADLRIRKEWADKPGIELRIWQVGPREMPGQAALDLDAEGGAE